MTPRALAIGAAACLSAALAVAAWGYRDTSESGGQDAQATHPFKEPTGLSGLVATFDAGSDFTIALDELELKAPYEPVSIDSVRFLADRPVDVVGAGLIPPGKNQRSWAGPGWNLKVPHKSSATIRALPADVHGQGGWVLAVGGHLPAGVDRITSRGFEVTYSAGSKTSTVKISRPIIFCANPKTRDTECVPGAERDISDMVSNGAG